MADKMNFACDYSRGAHPKIMERLLETNLVQTAGYGLDVFSESAKEKIRSACACPEAEVEFLVGGTQTNATVIDALLRSFQGVIAAETGHISTHEAGAIEAGGHKVLTLPHDLGKLSADCVRAYLENYYNDENHDHMVMPGMVYISHPTEFGTLYSRNELMELKKVCDDFQIPLYLDGARLAYALTCPENDVSLEDLARLCTVFYIGGTKCGTLFGEAVVIPKPGTIPHFFTIIKQHGALLAKGRAAGVQFDALFTDGLYETIGMPAIQAADQIRNALKEKAYTFAFDSPTNQIFICMEDERLKAFGEKVEYSFWEKLDETHTVIRLATDWATTTADVEALAAVF